MTRQGHACRLLVCVDVVSSRPLGLRTRVGLDTGFDGFSLLCPEIDRLGFVRLEMQDIAVDAVTLSGRRRTVFKDMAEVDA